MVIKMGGERISLIEVVRKEFYLFKEVVRLNLESILPLMYLYVKKKS